MKKFLLCLSVATAFSIFPTNAETQYYASDPNEVYGLMNGISRNGRYAVVSDDEDLVAYFWTRDTPDEYEAVDTDALLYDVADNGIAVGAIVDELKFRAAIYNYNTNEWTQLPDHLAVLNEQYAICVTADAKIISGYEYDRDDNPDTGGRYYPVVWTLNEATGDYEITTFNDLILPDHQGFITECMSPDGKFIGGRLYCGAMAEIPAMIDVEKHEITFWNELETRIEPFYYKGEILGYYEEYYIDGYHDTRSDNTFSGEFISCDDNGNFYGHRTVALSVSEDGQDADLEHYACIYNYKTGEWTDILGVTSFSIGYDAKTMFATDAQMVVIENGEDEIESIYTGLGFESSDEISAITKGSADGKVLGGIYGIYNPAKQAPDYHPFMILLDNPLSDISEITIDHNSDIMILVARGQIEVAGANSVAVYDMSGKQVSSSASSNLKAGVYVVKADSVTRKVVVK
ncbi:MAG: T9SS type A sorting domain-containing protein [Bacteroides sp.]|nr:T9SS type A sorting domain-containing protein [Bacteroides sp.]